MKAYYKLTAEGYEVGSKPREGFIEYTVGSEPAELKALMDAEAQVQLVQDYKSLYLSIVADKLKSLDYDSLATVKLWEGDATYGAEATQILAWYKNVIATNYGILTAIEASTKYNASWVDAIPTEEEYVAEINAVVF